MKSGKSGKVVLVTGASRGIGAAIAEKFGTLGYCVAINYCSQKNAALEVKSKIEKSGSKAEIFGCNISDFDAAKKMVASVVKHFGKIDVLVNNAGIVQDKPLNEKTPDDWHKTLNVNLIAPFVLSVEAAKNMLNGGVIINISSTSSNLHNCNICDYDASKAALNTLSDNLAMFYQPKIRVNTVLPGWVRTDMSAAYAEEDEKNKNDFIYLNKIAKPEEIANVVCFLASDEARHINGAEIVVNGGGLN